MPFLLFVVFLCTVSPCIVWGLIHEDKLIEVEDVIIARIKANFAKILGICN